MDKIARIRQEIERRSHGEQGFNSEDAEYGYRSCARDLLSFLDTLSEEPDKSLEEAATTYAWEHQEAHTNEVGEIEFDYGPRYSAFIAGAEWQKQHIMEEGVQGTMDKDAFLVLSNGDALDFSPRLGKIAFDLQPGDKVRIIVMKEEEQI